MKIKVNNKEYNYDKEVNLEALAKELKINAYCAKVDNRLRELTYNVNSDCTVEFLDLTNGDAVNVYQATLRYVTAMAISNIDSCADVVFNSSISRSFYCDIVNSKNKIDLKYLTKVEEEIKRIIKSDYKITRTTLNKKEALVNYKKLQYNDKAEVLAYRPEDTVHFYECNKYLNYMFGYMLPSTSYLNEFKIKPYFPGFILQYPRAEAGGVIPKFEDAPTFSTALKKSNKWGQMIKGSYISQMNKKIENLEEVEFINLCEAKHNMQLAELGSLIKEKIENIRLIAVAGPSSSGKTTFTNRLKIELMIRGINPVMISIDDYYLGKSEAPKNEDGSPDLEHINALDVDLFNKDMLALISGEEVQLPHFNFETGKRELGKVVQVNENTPILIEGIHALNELLTESIPSNQKFRIYISPQVQMHIDNHNPISITDIRLLRRMVRDFKFRNSPAEETLGMWSSVRRGEFRWIYPNQENADFVFNSELTYELCVLKKYALPLLEKIPNDSVYFIQANRLVKFLKYFKDIEDEWIPCNSLLREFIGRSSFYRR
ncbi:MAG: nucleoside kinase [bacterium]